MSKDNRPVEVGDLFRDKDRRYVSPRIVKVVRGSRETVSGEYFFDALVDVVNAENWNEKLIGRHTSIRLDRLTDKTRFWRVSR